MLGNIRGNRYIITATITIHEKIVQEQSTAKNTKSGSLDIPKEDKRFNPDISTVLYLNDETMRHEIENEWYK